ncbi:MAG TPA: hypothetical protein VHB74_06500 [Devosia sp.]|jgi:hypothetical protein|nr:hypothetical protein [Devosia sp.]
MQIKYVLAVVLVGALAAPGTASQLAARSAMQAPLFTAPATVGTAGAFSDPNAEPRLSIQLPTRFTAIDVRAQELQTFRS